MRLLLCAVGQRMPAWVDAGVEEYRKRMPRESRLEVRPVAAADRRRGDAKRWKHEEAERLRQAAGGAHGVALDLSGRGWSTEQLSARMDDWRMGGRDVAFFVGGADGLDASLLAASDERWSLSALTLPHAVVRIVVAEQLYRAWTLLSGHPYHR